MDMGTEIKKVGELALQVVTRAPKKKKRKPAKKKTVKKEATKKKHPASKKKAVAKPKVKKAGKTVERSERLDFRLSKAEKARLTAKAKKLRRTVTSIVQEAIEKIK